MVRFLPVPPHLRNRDRVAIVEQAEQSRAEARKLTVLGIHLSGIGVVLDGLTKRGEDVRRNRGKANAMLISAWLRGKEPRSGRMERRLAAAPQTAASDDCLPPSHLLRRSAAAPVVAEVHSVAGKQARTLASQRGMAEARQLIDALRCAG